MNRQQLSLVVVLGLISSLPAFASDPSEQGGGWRTTAEETASSTLSGKLYRNSADQSGSVPYVVLDRWGVVRGYVSAAQGVDLESYLGQQVSLQGTIKTLPGGDMPYMTCQQVLGGQAETASRRIPHNSVPPRDESFVPVVRDQRSQEIASRASFPRVTTWPPIRPRSRGRTLARGRPRTPDHGCRRRSPRPVRNRRRPAEPIRVAPPFDRTTNQL